MKYDKIHIDPPCVIKSICPPDVSTHIDPPSGPKRIAIELTEGRSTISVIPGRLVEAGDLIGTVNGLPVKSVSRFTVIDVGDNWILGEYAEVEDNTYDEDYISKVLNSGSEFDGVMDMMTEYTSVNTFIKDYMLRCQFPKIAAYTKEHTSGDGKAVSTQKFIKSYTKHAESIIDKLNDAVKRICDKDNLKTHSENGTAQQIKDELDAERDSAFSMMIEQYRNVSVDGYCSAGSVGDFMMYEYYVDYLTSDEFIYDDTNPYVIELFNYISERIGIRSRLEMDTASIADEIVRFNEMTGSLLGKVWDPKRDNDYYAEIRSKFAYDFYINDTDDVEGQISDKGRVSLYSKVLSYLKALVSYKAPDSKTMTVNTSTPKDDGTSADVSVEVEVDADTDDVLKQLKKIAILFCRLRKFETGAKSTNAYSEYISDTDLNNIFTLKKKMGESYISDYKGGMLNSIGTSEKRYAGGKSSSVDNNSVLKKYLGALKSVTDEEAKGISAICDKAIRWYELNHGPIDDYSIFNSMKTAEWPSADTIHSDDTECDFYLISGEETSIAVPEGYEYSETSLATKYHMGQYMYWLRYLGIASAINCTIPLYWSTGLIAGGAPISLPVILIPIYPIVGRVTAVVCVGICGLAVYPTVLFVNMGSIFGCIIPMVNSIVDVIKNSVKNRLSEEMSGIGPLITPTVAASDAAITKANSEIAEYDKEIKDLRMSIKSDKETLKALKKKLRKTATMKAIKKGDD